MLNGREVLRICLILRHTGPQSRGCTPVSGDHTARGYYLRCLRYNRKMSLNKWHMIGIALICDLWSTVKYSSNAWTLVMVPYHPRSEPNAMLNRQHTAGTFLQVHAL